MQLEKDPTKGVQKNNDAEQQRVKAFDLDRKRDSDNIIDAELLNDVDYQLHKKNITFFDTDQLELLFKTGHKKTFWFGDGEVHITLSKEEPRYQDRLLKKPQEGRLAP